MTVGRIGGPMLKNNLVRQGVDLAFENNLLYLDVNNLRIGVNKSVPTVTLDVNGVVLFGGNLKFTGTTIESADTNGNITFQPNGTGSVVSTSPIYATRFISNIATGTAPLTVASTTQVANLNAETAGSATTAGTVTTAAQPNITSVGTLTSLGVSGTITGSQLISNVTTGTAPLVVTSTTQVANLNAATAGSATTAASATTAGTVTTAAQPNITSVGTLTSLGVSGTATASQLISNVVTGTAPLVVTSTTQVANLNAATAGTAVSATTAGTVTTAAQPNITSVGTLTALGVNGVVTAQRFVSNIATGTAPLVVTSTTQVANLNAATAGSATTAASATTAGTVTTAAQPNITSVGTLSSVNVTGPVTAGGFTMNDPIQFGFSEITEGKLIPNMLGAYSEICNFVPINSAEYYDGSSWVDWSSKINELNRLFDGRPNTYVSIPVANKNFRFTAQLQSYHNGALWQIYQEYIAGGPVQYNVTIERCADSTFSSGVTTILSGTSAAHSYFYNKRGYSHSNETWYRFTFDMNLTSIAGTLVWVKGFTGRLSYGRYQNLPMTWDQYQNVNIVGAVSASRYVSNAATGTPPLTVMSTTQVANLNAATAGTVTTAAQPNITSVGTLSSLGVSGSVTASTLISNIVTGTAPFTVTSTTQVANLNAATAGTAVSATTAGTVTTAAQPNITSVGTLTSLGVSGSVTASQLISNVTTGTAPLVVTSTTQVANLNAATAGSATTAVSATTAGTVTTAAQPNITSVGTLSSLGVSGSITASTLISNIATGTAPFTVNSTTQVANLNAETAGSATTAGTVTTAAQPNITSVGTLSSLGVSGTITGSQLVSNVTTGTAPFVVTSTTQVANLNAATAGSALTAGSATTATTAGTVTTAAQPNITSVGTLTSLGVSGSVTASQLISNVTTGTAPFTVSSTTQVANLNAATAGSASTASTVTTAAQPNITSVGTLSSLSISGNVAVDTNVLFVDTSNDRIGINKTPNVTLDISGTDAVQLPVGNTAVRPTPSAGMIRYNSELASFEGYTTTWGSIGGGSASVTVSDTAPLTPTAGDLWWNSTVGTLKIYYDDGSGSQWVDASINSISSTSVPLGGTTGQILTKASNADYDSTWADPAFLGSTGSTDNRLLRADGTGGKTIQSSAVTLDDSGNFSGIANIASNATVTAETFVSNIATGTAPFVVNSTTQVANLNAATAGTVTTAAQPNITSVGTLTNLTVSGNTTVGSNGITFSDTSTQTTAGISTGKAIAMAIVFG